MKKTGFSRLAALLLAALTVFAAVACGSADVPAETTAGADTQAPVPEESTAEETTGPQLTLPDMDFGGEEFTLFCREARVKDFYIEEDNGVLLEQAVFSRNAVVEDKYKTKISVITCPDNSGGGQGVEFNQKLAASTQAGCGDYDAVAPDYYWGCETKGYFVNLLDLPYFSFDSDWWWKSWNDCFTINGRLSSAVGWLTLDIVKGMEVVYFSKGMMKDLGIAEPYQLVYDRAWTIDKMMEMSKSATFNVDGKGATDPANYCYGTILHYMGAWSMLFGMGAKIAEYDQDGSVTLDLGTERNEQAVSALSGWMHRGENDVFYAASGDVGHNLSNNENPVDTANMFVGGHSLFYCYGIKAAELLASMDAQFGLLPPPLMDADQENYVTTTFGTSYFAIERGLSQQNQEFSAFILEALNYYAYTMVKDVYYENNLKIRYASDYDTSSMVDYVVKSTYIDFAHVTDNYTGGLRAAMLNAAVNGTALASQWKALQKVSQKKLAEYIDGYLK